ncbi:hypothetical protein GCM10009838_38020 [Catenulispora subtropica]|uniref:Uncharacterized protein n=1 Tax=Catenulispora subtropica TaxID=450798 RepID=A0ABP5D6M2_9ACTN
MSVARRVRHTAATPSSHTRYCGDSTRLVTTATSTAARPTSASIAGNGNPPRTAARRRISSSAANPAAVATSAAFPAAVTPVPKYSNAPNSVGRAVPDQPNHFPTRNGEANTDSTWMPRLFWLVRKDSTPGENSWSSSVGTTAAAAATPTSSRPLRRFGAPNSNAAGHSLRNAPTPISAPRVIAVARLERSVTVSAATAVAVTTRS